MIYDPDDKCRVLKPEYEDIHASWDAWGGGCSCHINPPCSWCTDEGNILNLQNDPDAWESPLTYMVREVTSE